MRHIIGVAVAGLVVRRAGPRANAGRYPGAGAAR